VSLLVLYVGELIPMGVAANHGQRIALALAPLLLLLTRVLSPLLLVLARLARLRPERRECGGDGDGNGDPAAHGARPYGRRDRGTRAGTHRACVPAGRHEDMGDHGAPRRHLRVAGQSYAGDIAPELATVRHSRMPVYGESMDDITGVLYLRDAYQALLAGQRDARCDAGA
jgi:putative hemolysin